MKIKTLIVTVLALAALSVVAYLINRPAAPRAADPRVNQPVLLAATAEAAAKVKISDQGKSVLLTKQSNGTWNVSSYHDLPADFSKLSTLIGEMTSGKIEQLVTTNPEKLGRLEFKEAQVALLDAADKPLWSVTMGKIAEAGGRFIRFGDEPKAFRAKVDAWLDPESKSWADAALVRVKTDDVARIEISMPDGSPVVATRAKKEDPFATENPLSGRKLNANKITSVLSSLTTLRFTETTEPTDPAAAAAQQNLRSFKLTTFDGKAWTVALGRKPEQKVVKPPVATTDGKTGPAVLGTMTNLTKEGGSDAAEKNTPPEIVAPEIETIPAGPVYAFVSSSTPEESINSLMNKRGFQIGEYEFTSLPQKTEELFETASPAAPTTPAPTASNPVPPTGPSGAETPTTSPSPPPVSEAK